MKSGKESHFYKVLSGQSHKRAGSLTENDSVMKTHFNSQKIESAFISQSLGYHGLGAAWGPIEQDSFRWLDAHSGEGLRVPQRPLHSLLQFQLHLCHPTNI